MRRRDFITLIGGAAVAPMWPSTARAQKTPERIGYLASGSGTSPIGIDRVAAIKEGLRDNGLIEGRDYLLAAVAHRHGADQRSGGSWSCCQSFAARP
jgi:putative tryptophan/tyrosine transport system substrate-binding protein